MAKVYFYTQATEGVQQVVVKSVEEAENGITVRYTDGTVQELDTRHNMATNATLFYSEWAGDQAPYRVRYHNADIAENSIVELAPGLGITAEQLAELQAANIIGGEQQTGSITLLAYGTKPTGNIPVQFVVRSGIK